jgi:hypothetical protein
MSNFSLQDSEEDFILQYETFVQKRLSLSDIIIKLKHQIEETSCYILKLEEDLKEQVNLN